MRPLGLAALVLGALDGLAAGMADGHGQARGTFTPTASALISRMVLSGTCVSSRLGGCRVFQFAVTVLALGGFAGYGSAAPALVAPAPVVRGTVAQTPLAPSLVPPDRAAAHPATPGPERARIVHT